MESYDFTTKLEKIEEEAKKHNVKVDIYGIIDKDHLDCTWYGGEVGTITFEDGYILINDRPGLGIDVNVEEVEKRPYHPINLRHYTGTLTDIRPKDDTVFYFKGIGDNK